MTNCSIFHTFTLLISEKEVITTAKPTGEMLAQTAYRLAVASTGTNDGQTPKMAYEDIDCQAFVEKALSDIGFKKNWSGSNAMWRDMQWKGTPEECKKQFGRIPVGAWLFIWTSDMDTAPARYKNDGEGNATHVGIYTRLGKGAAHSSSSRGGVCQSVFNGKTIKNGGWNRVGLPGFIDFGIGDNKNTIKQSEIEVIITEEQAIITSDNGAGARLRNAPSVKNNTVIRNLPEGTVVDVLDEDGAWTHVQVNGQAGYVMSAFLNRQSSPVSIENSSDSIQVTMTRSLAIDLYNSIGAALKGGDSNA